MSVEALPPPRTVEEALGRVHDPCSVAAGRPKTLIEMGLVLDWRWTAPGQLHVDLCVTFAGCTMAPHFVEAARRELMRLEGAERVELEVDTNFFWTPERMSGEEPPRGTPPEPQAWRKVASGR